MTQVAEVLRIDRVAQRAECLIGGRSIEMARFDDGFPPPPMSGVLLDRIDGPGWTITGSLSDRRELLHDDFLRVEGGSGYGDTPWNLLAFATGPGPWPNSGDGVSVIPSPATTNALQGIKKDNRCLAVPADGYGYWLSWRSSAATTTAIVHVLGLLDDSVSDGAYVSWVGPSSMNFNTRIALATTSAVMPEVISDLAFHDFDIVITDGWAACWVDGSGPTVLGGVPVANGYQPLFYVQTTEAVTKHLFMDWVHLERFGIARRPDLRVTMSG